MEGATVWRDTEFIGSQPDIREKRGVYLAFLFIVKIRAKTEIIGYVWFRTGKYEKEDEEYGTE